MEEGECVRRAPAPPTASILFNPGEEREAHRSLDSLLEPEEKESTAKSTIMDWDEAGDRSLMEWQEEEEPERVRKRKRETCKRSKNIPPERKGSTMKKKKRSKYLLVGVPKIREYSDHPRMAALDLRIRRAALIIEKKYGSTNTSLYETPSFTKFSNFQFSRFYNF